MSQRTPKRAPGEGRSVNYPVMTVEAAIDRARRLWADIGRNAVAMATAGAAWGYAGKSSGLRSTVSALRQYGLLAASGEGDGRQVRLTDRALDVLLEPPGSSRHRDALQAAVLSPKIYRAVFDRFQPGLPPHDHAIVTFLLRDKAFNRKAVGGFISALRANLLYADLHHPVRVPALEDRLTPPPAATQPSHASARGPASEGFHQDVYALGAEGEVLLRWPQRISQAAYEELTDWIELELKKIARINGLKRRAEGEV